MRIEKKQTAAVTSTICHLFKVKRRFALIQICKIYIYWKKTTFGLKPLGAVLPNNAISTCHSSHRPDKCKNNIHLREERDCLLRFKQQHNADTLHILLCRELRLASGGVLHICLSVDPAAVFHLDNPISVFHCHQRGAGLMLLELLLEEGEVLQGCLCAQVQMVHPTCHMLALIEEEKKTT